MEEFNHDTYCGLYCGACDILKAYKTGHKSEFASFWTESTIESYLKTREVTYERDDLKLKCHGCKSDDVFINCKYCEIRKCAINKNVAHCSDCEDYPCEIYSNWKKAQTVLPHMESTQGNLDTIDEVGVDKWLLDQEKQWKCPECGMNFSWYSTSCDSCGNDLKEYSFKFSKLKSLFMKLGLRLSSLRQK